MPLPDTVTQCFGHPTNRKLSAITTYLAVRVTLPSLPLELLHATPPSASGVWTSTKFCENARGWLVIGASGSKLVRLRFAPCVEAVADFGAVEADRWRAEEDSGVWCETVPETVRVTEGGVKFAGRQKGGVRCQYVKARMRDWVGEGVDDVCFIYYSIHEWTL